MTDFETSTQAEPPKRAHAPWHAHPVLQKVAFYIGLVVVPVLGGDAATGMFRNRTDQLAQFPHEARPPIAGSALAISDRPISKQPALVEQLQRQINDQDTERTEYLARKKALSQTPRTMR